MKQSVLPALLFASLLCCGGGGGGARSSKVVTKPTAPPVVDPALAARRAFANPGGMWMPRQMTLPVHARSLTAMGVAIDAAALADPLGEPLGAVVRLSGCTGSFVSPEGLIITNHHCVQTSLQVNATPDHNYVEDGFLAKTRADELPAGPAEHVLVTQAARDVTADITGGLADIADPGARTKEIEKREKTLVAACEKGRPGIRCEVESFYRGAEYQLIERLEIRDIRVVHAPARSIGNYGGEIDNWAWPRHTGDYSFLRAYVAKDGSSAEPSPENVPYQPKHWLKVASKPLAESDFVLVAGYPGSTERLTTYSEVKFDVDVTYPDAIEQIQEAYDVLEELQKKGGMTGIKAGMFKQFVQNALENYQGTLAGLKRGDSLARKQALDESVRAWAKAPGREDYAQAIESLEASFVEERGRAKTDSMFARAALGRGIFSTAHLIVRMAEERQKKDPDRKAGFQDRDLPDLVAQMKQLSAQYDADIDRAFMRRGLVRAMAMPEVDRPWLATMLGAKKGEAVSEALIDKRIEEWFAGTTLTDEKARLELLTKGTTKRLRGSKDPIIKAALAMRPALKEFEERHERWKGERVLLGPKYAVAMREALDGALAPDANFTLRLTYGTVKRRGEGRPFTVASEIPAKDKGAEPFDAPKALLAAVKAKQWGPYEDPTLGEVPVDFLSDVDTTGGNSGSPTLNDQGELVGLLFDGTIESVSSDVVFDPIITRSIHADIRYALWAMDVVDGAD
ncbi:MAG TPA: S46 family peptidase, partial [Kofleriaceae bacterium]|nr:S46 family peptidase [Kofleriaceae bacterium]